jgi:hypothetical protein
MPIKPEPKKYKSKRAQGIYNWAVALNKWGLGQIKGIETNVIEPYELAITKLLEAADELEKNDARRW